MLLLVEIGLTIFVCNRLRKAGKKWGLGCLPGIAVILIGTCIAVNAINSGMSQRRMMASIPIWPDILATIVLIIMAIVIKPNPEISPPPTPPAPPAQ